MPRRRHRSTHSIPDYEIWWIGFQPIPTARWFRHISKTHCYAFTQTLPGFCTVIDPQLERLRCVPLVAEPAELIAFAREQDHKLIVARRPRIDLASPAVPRRGPILTCASLIGYALGYQKFMLTPEGLARCLLADGGKYI